jgi:hypothetical protein
MHLPAAIIFLDSSVSSGVQATLQKQLFITDVMDGYHFDTQTAISQAFANNLKLQSKRVLVVRDFSDKTNRDLCDVAIVINMGLAYIEVNKVGPRGQTYKVDTLTIYQLMPQTPGNNEAY